MASSAQRTIALVRRGTRQIRPREREVGVARGRGRVRPCVTLGEGEGGGGGGGWRVRHSVRAPDLSSNCLSGPVSQFCLANPHLREHASGDLLQAREEGHDRVLRSYCLLLRSIAGWRGRGCHGRPVLHVEACLCVRSRCSYFTHPSDQQGSRCSALGPLARGTGFRPSQQQHHERQRTTACSKTFQARWHVELCLCQVNRVSDSLQSVATRADVWCTPHLTADPPCVELQWCMTVRCSM